jgi:hypothetical protein
MYEHKQFDVVPRTFARPLTFPIRILVSQPPGPPIFNPFAMMQAVFGRFVERGRLVFQPQVYAADMAESELLRQYQLTPETSQTDELFVRYLSPGGLRRYDITHLAGRAARVSDGLASDLLLRTLATSSNTRLLIMQVAEEDRLQAIAFAESVVRDRGPAVLVVSGRPERSVDVYLNRVYQEVVHNRPLTEAAQTRKGEDSLSVYLFLGRGGESLLQFAHLAAVMQRRFESANETESRLKSIDDQVTLELRFLGEGSRQRLLPNHQRIQGQMQEYRQNLARTLTPILDFRQESRGALPLAEAMEGLTTLERGSEGLLSAVDSLRERIYSGATSAPRVLNAGFSGITGKMASPTDILLPQTDYDLLVDIGPRWDKLNSIVVGNQAFPEFALPPTKGGSEGHQIRVVAVSDDFSPGIVSVSLFLPAGHGRSVPMLADSQSKVAGPVKLRLQTPALNDDPSREVRLRLSLYYETNLLQSGVLSAWVGNAPIKGGEQKLEVDYVLSGTFQQLASEFKDRTVTWPGRGATSKGVTLNLTLNDDGAAGHRITVVAANVPSAAVIPYDSLGGTEFTNEARDALLALFFEKDASGAVDQVAGLAADFGKSLPQFKRDLWALARLGRRALLAAFSQARVENAADTIPLAYLRELESTIQDSSLIQISRTGPAQYVFPWALLYSHNLLGDSSAWRYCEVIDDQWKDGRRSGSPLGRCPYHIKPGDHENVICPMGFWGLRHVIEQPLSLIVKGSGYGAADSKGMIKAGTVIQVALAKTADATMAQAIDAHISELAQSKLIRFVPPTGATNTADAIAVFETPEMVYILCHGKFDKDEKQPYLGIGINDQSHDHRIYPTTLSEWFLKEDRPNLSAWVTKRPLVLVNGCHTCDLLPGQMLNLVTALNGVGAGGVIGTEISVQLPLAAEIAKSLFRYLTLGVNTGMGVGEAIHRTRWDLLNRGNLLGLAYTAYCRADLHFELQSV